jgi:hypothetical protein
MRPPPPQLELLREALPGAYIDDMNKALFSGAWTRRSLLTLGVILLAYAILLRGLATPLPALPGSLEAALANPHYLCLTDANGKGIPSHGPQACGECCLGLTRATTPPPALAPILTPWPRLVWRPAAPSLTALRDEPPEEAWTKAHSQRGPPESRSPTSVT